MPREIASPRPKRRVANRAGEMKNESSGEERKIKRKRKRKKGEK
jgi:hypothetical protein